MPDVLTPDKLELVKELQRRRDTLSPDKQALVDELSRRAQEQAAGAVPQAAPPEEKTLAGFGGNLLQSGAKFVGDIGQGLMAAPGLIKSAITDPVQVGEAAVEASKGIPDYLSKRYGGGQQILDTLYKDPVGFAADLSTLFAGGGAAAKLGGMGRLAEGLSTASKIADPVAQVGRAIRAPAAMVGRAVGAPELLYKNALRPSSAGEGGIARARKSVAHGLSEEIPVTRSREAEFQAENIIKDMKAKVKEKIAAIPEGTTIDPHDIASRADEIRPNFENVRAEIDQKRIDSAKETFLKRYEIKGEKLPGIPGEERLKDFGINPDRYAPTTYKQLSPEATQLLKQKSGTRLTGKYGAQKTPTVEAEKALTRGAKEILEEIAPGIDALNERWSSTIGLKKDLMKAAERVSKNNVFGLGPPLAAGAGHALGGPAGAWTLAVLKVALDQPEFASKLAIAINQSQKLKGSALTKLATARRATEDEGQ